MNTKTFLSAVLMTAAVALFASCSSYPASLAGTWVEKNASTGYTTTLTVEDVSDGQYASFTMVSPVQEVTYASEGSFVYDPSTGEGYISSLMLGGPVVHVYASPGTDRYVDVAVTQMVSGGSMETIYEATLKKN